MSLTRRRVLQALGTVVAGSRVIGFGTGAARADAAAVPAVQSPPSYAGIVGLL